ncbi:endo-beta-glucanase [Ephemerocybe angulata]|uniref:Endo-beta-glucanase n=1 Tax=Ephemerocybe angulata TaxID=980116 RepID=A0A8H6IEY6_9AGAR|nr:endo-beta-glucanase [Tulosesus angulatus]
MTRLLTVTLLTYIWLTLASKKPGTKYKLSEEYVGEEFLDLFEFEAIADPTHGRVEYVNSEVAWDEGMVVAEPDSFLLRPDSKSVLSSRGPGRKSFRLKSRHQYGAGTVMIFNIRHMPEGCGTWPAVWTVGMPWPQMGEIDILEGVNDEGPNHVTLHTSHSLYPLQTQGCDMPNNRLQTGQSTKDTCGIGFLGTDYVGCGVKVGASNSYGPAFNRNGGGWYAMERTESFIKVWFWARSSDDTPSGVLESSLWIDTNKWGPPTAYFPSNRYCDLNAKFGLHNIVINLTFCGDWAGNTYRQSGCPSTCIDYVNKNPSAFKKAYFDFHSLRVYDGGRKAFKHNH